MELDSQAIQVANVVLRKGSHMVVDLRRLVQSLVREHNRQKSAEKSKPPQGQQSMKELAAQNKKLENVKIDGADLKAFKQELNRYAVDFSLMKDKENGKYSVFFKAQDIERVYKGLEKCVRDFALKDKDKRPVQETMMDAKEKAAEQAAEKAPEKSQKREASL